jgi:glycerol-3-phosphate dehydrogenase (NAD(P)+)
VKTVTVLGAGSWGTALAAHAGRAGHDVRLWARNPALVDEMNVRRVNAVYLPGIELPASVRAEASLAAALADVELIICAVPSHGTRAIMRAAAPLASPRAIVVSATKGLEAGTLFRISEVIAQERGGASRVAVLSGPSFAAEVARDLPTAVCVAAADPEVAAFVQAELRGRHFRLYASTDLIGVEIGGALKNVIAIAAGVVEGLGLGHNALAALITRGLTEVTRLACALGARRETLSGLTGLGDLVLTCTGTLSRNRRVGIELARGRPLPEILAGMKMVAEGVATTSAALALGQQYGVELPITTQMAEILAGRRQPAAGVEELMLRRQRPEPDADGTMA